VSFYRVYRGSTELSGRYGVSLATTFTDNDAVAAHSYWVTAVGVNFAESSPLGPASG
jgi:hypothetical protein